MVFMFMYYGTFQKKLEEVKNLNYFRLLVQRIFYLIKNVDELISLIGVCSKINISTLGIEIEIEMSSALQLSTNISWSILEYLDLSVCLGRNMCMQSGLRALCQGRLSVVL